MPSIKTGFYPDEVFLEDETRYTEISHFVIQLPKIILALKSKFYILPYASLFVKLAPKHNLENPLKYIHNSFCLEYQTFSKMSKENKTN